MKLHVELGERSYDIRFGAIAGEELKSAFNTVAGKRAFMVVSDRNVARVTGFLADAANKVILPPGEQYKKLAAVEGICNAAADYHLDRGSFMVAFGGGVVGDLTGFAAAIYMRGIDFIQIPTTLLAMVDSSVGGKTGADLAGGKNLVGAFHQPKLVLIDPAFLATLPREEVANGMAEVVKYAVIFDAELFAELDFRADALNAVKPDVVLPVIRRCCELKADVVAQDEKEKSGLRALLNYGHTFGHAVELLSKFTIPHGAAVSIGMCAAGNLSCELGYWSREDALRQKTLLEKFRLPTAIPEEFSAAAVSGAMRKDKKNADGRIRLVLPHAIGRAELHDKIDETLIRSAVEATR